MANPQLEDGYIKIATKIMQALIKTRIPGEARQVLDCILSKSYGKQRKRADITNSVFAATTGVSRPHVTRALKVLFDMNIIVLEEPNIYRFQKNFNAWKSLPKRGTIMSEMIQKPVAKKGNKPKPPQSAKVSQPDNAITPQQKVVKAYRIKRFPGLSAKPEPQRTTAIAKWNADNYGRCSREAMSLIQCFSSWEEAVDCIDWVGSFMNQKDLNWNLRTVITWSTDYNLKKDGENHGKSSSD